MPVASTQTAQTLLGLKEIQNRRRTNRKDQRLAAIGLAIQGASAAAGGLGGAFKLLLDARRDRAQGRQFESAQRQERELAEGAESGATARLLQEIAGRRGITELEQSGAGERSRLERQSAFDLEQERGRQRLQAIPFETALTQQQQAPQLGQLALARQAQEASLEEGRLDRSTAARERLDALEALRVTQGFESKRLGLEERGVIAQERAAAAAGEREGLEGIREIGQIESVPMLAEAKAYRDAGLITPEQYLEVQAAAVEAQQIGVLPARPAALEQAAAFTEALKTLTAQEYSDILGLSVPQGATGIPAQQVAGLGLLGQGRLAARFRRGLPQNLRAPALRELSEQAPIPPELQNRDALLKALLGRGTDAESGLNAAAALLLQSGDAPIGNLGVRQQARGLYLPRGGATANVDEEALLRLLLGK